MWKPISLLAKTSLLSVHCTIFLIFELLPPLNTFHPVFDFVRCANDSISKSRLISNTIRISFTNDKSYFFKKLMFALFSTQFGKYLFERFLIKSREEQSFYRNSSIVICILIYSTNSITTELFNDKIFFATSLILLIGNRMDQWYCHKSKVRSRQQGQSKLRPNAKT